MKQYTFRDGFKCVASTKEEAMEQHRSVGCASRHKKKPRKKQTKYNHLTDIDQYALLKSAGFKQDKEYRDEFVSKSNPNITAEAVSHGGFAIYLGNKTIFEYTTEDDDALYFDGLSKGLSENEVDECMSKYYEDLVKWLKSSKDKIHNIKSISEVKSLNIPKCEFKSNDKVVKVIKTIQLIKTKMDEALNKIQEKKDELGGKKLLQDAYKKLGKLI